MKSFKTFICDFVCVQYRHADYIGNTQMFCMYMRGDLIYEYNARYFHVIVES